MIFDRRDMVSTIPGPSLFGHVRYLKALLGNPYEALLRLQSEYGNICRFGYGRHQYILVFGAEANELLLNDSPNRPRFHLREVLGLLIPVVGSSAMVVSDGEDHRRRRILVQPAFAHRRLHTYIPIMIDEINSMIGHWRVGETIDAFQEVRSCIRRIAIRSLFGERLKEHSDTIGNNLQIALNYINRSPFLRFDLNLPGTAYWRAMRARSRVVDLVNREIANRRERSEPLGDGGDVLDVLLDSVTPAGERLNDVEVRDQVVSLIASGYDSSSSAAGWAIYAVLSRPQVYAKIAEEVSVVQDDDDLTLPIITSMTYLGWTIKEILRLYTPGVLTGRTAVEASEFAGHVVPSGTKILYSQYVTHRLPQLWSNPDLFRPERWDPSQPDYREPAPYSWIPFGGGHRHCIGFTFAELELRILMIQLVRKSKLKLASECPVQPVGVATMWPKGGVSVIVEATSSV